MRKGAVNARREERSRGEPGHESRMRARAGREEVGEAVLWRRARRRAKVVIWNAPPVWGMISMNGMSVGEAVPFEKA